MPTILEDYIAKHPGSARRYEESVTVFPRRCHPRFALRHSLPPVYDPRRGPPQVGRGRQ